MTTRRSRSEYERLLARREREGLSYRELAERTGLKAATLAWWGWRLRREGAEAVPFAEVVATSDADASEAGTSGITIECGAVRVHVARDFDGAALRRVLDLLAQRC